MKITKSKLRMLIREAIISSSFSDSIYLEILDFLHSEVFKFDNFNVIKITPNSPAFDNGNLYRMMQEKSLGKQAEMFFIASPTIYRSHPQIVNNTPVITAYETNKKHGGYIFYFKEEKINEIINKFTSKFNKIIPVTRNDGQKIKSELYTIVKPEGKPLVFIVFPMGWEGSGGSGSYSDNVVFMKTKITGSITIEDESDLPEDPKQAFSEIIKRRSRLVIDHEFTHAIDNITGIFDQYKEETQNKLKSVNFGPNPSTEQAEAHMKVYAPMLHEINARLITAFRYFKNTVFPKLYEEIFANQNNPQVWKEKWIPISSKENFIKYYKDTLSEYAMKDKRRYYEFLDKEMLDHFEDRITFFYVNNISSQSKWRYLEMLYLKNIKPNNNG